MRAASNPERLHAIQTVIHPIGPDLFVMDQDARTHLRYPRKDGAITGLQFEHADRTSNIVTKG